MSDANANAGSQLDRIERKVDRLVSYDHILRRLAEIQRELHRIEEEIARFTQELKRAVDLNIVFEPQPHAPKGSSDMAKKASGAAVKCPCLKPKGSKVGAVMPDITLTDPVPKSITLQPIDASGQPVPLTPADQVQTTLASDSPNFVITPVDATHFTGTVPANTPQGSVANLSATLTGTVGGAAADFTASVKVTINLPPGPAVDLEIIFG